MAVTDILIGEASDALAHVGDRLLFSTGWVLSELRAGRAPVVLQLTDQAGVNLPGVVHVHQKTRPYYLAVPPAVANGRLPIYALGQGAATLTLTYDDPVAGRLVKDLQITVIESVESTAQSGLTLDPWELAWSPGQPLTWE